MVSTLVSVPGSNWLHLSTLTEFGGSSPLEGFGSNLHGSRVEAVWYCRWRWVWGRGQAHSRQPEEGAPQQQQPPQVSEPISAVGGGSPPPVSNPGDQQLSNTPHNFPNMHSEPLASMQVRPFPWAGCILSVCLKKS